MKPILVQLGPFPISSFGLFLLIAFLVGIAMVRRRGRQLGIEPSRMLDIALYMIIGGIVAGRLGYVAVNFPSFVADPMMVITIWRDSGLTFYGAVVGGLIVGALYARRLGIPMRTFIDLFAPALAFGYAVAMIGGLLHGLYLGRPSGVPWGVQMFLERRHPTQIYLMLASLGTYAVLRAQERASVPAGTLFFLWLLLHSLSRIAVEFFVESPGVLGTRFTLAQVVNAAVMVIALVGVFVVGRGRGEEPEEPGMAPSTPAQMPPAP